MCEGATEIGLISFANTIKNQILGRISSEKKKKLGIVLDCDQSMSQCHDFVEGKCHTGIYKQESVLPRYMK